MHVITELSVNLPLCSGDHCVCTLAEMYYLIHTGGAIAVPNTLLTEDYLLQKPYLEVRVEDNGNSRSKRMLNMHYMDCKEQTTVSLCCRYNLRADFDEIGWDWILQPRSYEAFFCAGECPFYFNPGYAHSHLVKVIKYAMIIVCKLLLYCLSNVGLSAEQIDY